MLYLFLVNYKLRKNKFINTIASCTLLLFVLYRVEIARMYMAGRKFLLRDQWEKCILLRKNQEWEGLTRGVGVT